MQNKHESTMSAVLYLYNYKFRILVFNVVRPMNYKR